LLALAPLARAPDEPPRLRGFSAEASRAQRAAEASLVSTLSAASLDTFHAELTARPHVAGTPESLEQAERIRRRLEAFGFETEVRRYEAYLSLPRSIAVRRTAPTKVDLSVEEPSDPDDPDTARAGLTPGFVAYSASGTVDGPVVYANYGLLSDYGALDSLGVSVRESVVLVRYGKVHRAVKVANAQARGARAILIYSDPADDGFRKGEPLPKGPWRAAQLLQRGNAKLSWFFHGDPLTPGKPALAAAERLRPEDAPSLPKIPALALSWSAARPLLEALSGRAPEEFQGGLDLTYGTGPGPARVAASVEMDARMRPIANVLGRLRGREEPESQVLLGTHHDAWTFGGVDPGSSGAAILELCRSLGELVRTGWRPRRSLVVAFWDAEEPGLIGSTEFAEEQADELRRRAVAYVNSDLYLAGRLRAGGPPALEDFARDVARDVRDPGTGEPGLPGAASLELQPLGSGADFVAFQDYLGLPSLSLEFGAFTNYGAYHSAWDTRRYMKTHGDPGWRYGVTLAELLGRTVMRLAAADSVPLRPSREAAAILRWLERVEAEARLEGLEPLRSALGAYGEEAASVERRIDDDLRSGGRGADFAGEAGQRLLASLKAFVDEGDREFYRHPVYGWDIHALYGGDTLPGLGLAAREGDGPAQARERLRLEAAVERARRALAAKR
jgi:N-acetylated-alpha-linked acidic dipeptidase